MKRLAIIICNFNKQEYVLKCIKSVLESNYKEFDLYVVDNASNDDSVKAIKEKYNRDVNLIVNDINKGGAGGFNTGIKVALKKEYQYLMLLDNDVIVERSAISKLVKYLDIHEKVGMVGSKIYSMDTPKQLQELGARIDFENYSINPFYKGFIDDGSIPKEIECDYVPACSMMVRKEAVEKVGIMREENFIYWDDIEWGYKFKIAGYKVVAYSKSIVWHKMGIGQKINTFGTYYFWRNRLSFFIRYCNDTEKFAIKIFDEIFQAIYMCNFLKKYNSAKSICYALEDALNNISGKAQEGRIVELEQVKDRLNEILNDKKNILIINNVEIEVLRNLMRIVNNCKARITICDNKKIKEQFGDFNIVNNIQEINLTDYDLICSTCFHVLEIEEKLLKQNEVDLYVDRYLNLVFSDEERNYVLNYNKSYKLAKNIWYPFILDKIIKIRNDEAKESWK